MFKKITGLTRRLLTNVSAKNVSEQNVSEQNVLAQNVSGSTNIYVTTKCNIIVQDVFIIWQTKLICFLYHQMSFGNNNIKSETLWISDKLACLN